jgi:DNA replication and repair protein RecF
MKIFRTRLSNFRNHEASEFEFGAHMNVLLGENGMGKTNALEALSFLCLTKSFYAGADATALQREKSFFEIESSFESDGGKEFRIRIAYDDNRKEKKFTINNAEVEKFSSVLGMFPVVILSPENNSITFGSPADRRRFVDIVISQSSPGYVSDMMEYRRIVRQRNRILSDGQGRSSAKELTPWTEMLIRYGSRIIDKRNRFLNEFAPYIANTYMQIVDERETPKIEYAPTVALHGDSTLLDIEKLLETKIAKKNADEARFQTSLVGPHRDEIIFSLNGMSLKHFASQGQHKTFLVALKVAEFFYLKERCNETPVFLFDDVFSELDEYRSQKLLTVVESLGQTFITATGEATFGGAEWNNDRRKFFIKNGAVIKEAIA